jgi:hypothetical protein
MIMPAFLSSTENTETLAQCDPACPIITGYCQLLIDEPYQYAPMSLRLSAFEAIHIRSCERCERFSRVFHDWVQRNRRERALEQSLEIERRALDEMRLLQLLNEGTDE